MTAEHLTCRRHFIYAGRKPSKQNHHPYKNKKAFKGRSEQLQGDKARNMLNIWLMHRHKQIAVQDLGWSIQTIHVVGTGCDIVHATHAYTCHTTSASCCCAHMTSHNSAQLATLSRCIEVATGIGPTTSTTNHPHAEDSRRHMKLISMHGRASHLAVTIVRMLAEVRSW